MELLTDIHAVYGDNDARRRDLLTQLSRDAIQRLDLRSVEVFLGALRRWEAGDPSDLDLRQILGIGAWAPDYIRKPVSVREFILREDYLGRGVGRDTYPVIIDALEELFEGAYTEAILTGAIGSGKSRCAEIGIAYDLYQVSCLRNPATSYGLMSGSSIAFVNCSVTQAQARRVLFSGLASMLSQSDYFTQVFRFDPNVKRELRFPNSVIAYPVAASEQAQLGEGIFAAAIDEANFMQVVEHSRRKTPGMAGVFDQAEAVYEKLKARMRSRMNQLGKLPGHIYLISSARYPNDFIERMERAAREPENRNRTFVRHWTAWQTAPHKFLPTRFRVEVGDVTRRSRVLKGGETDINADRVIEVPIDLYPEFVKNPEASVRDYAGISTLSIKPFIAQREKIQRMFELGEAAGLSHPFSRQNVTLQERDPGLERLQPERLHWVERPKRHAEDKCTLLRDGKPFTERVLFDAPYCAHFDLSKSKDATGFVVGHVVGSKRVTRLVADLKGHVQEVREDKPVIRIDLVLRIVAPPNGQVDIPAARMLIYQLRGLGMWFSVVSFDQMGSQESIKSLHDKGIHSEEYSVDRTTTAYDELRTALYDERLLCYHDETRGRELAQLEDTGKKIEHPPNGSKDLGDCLAAVVHHCEASWAKGEGCRGLFQFGVVERPEELSEIMQNNIEAALAKVVEGQQLSEKEEDTILFQGLDQL